MVRNVFECREDLETQPFSSNLHDRRESGSPRIGCLNQFEGVGKGSLKFGQEGARIDERVMLTTRSIQASSSCLGFVPTDRPPSSVAT